MLPSEYGCYDSHGKHYDQKGRTRVFQLEADSSHINSGSSVAACRIPL